MSNSDLAPQPRALGLRNNFRVLRAINCSVARLALLPKVLAPPKAMCGVAVSRFDLCPRNALEVY